MKNICYLSLLMLAMFLGVSCKDSSFLDETVTSDIDFEAVFSDSTYTVGFLTEIYIDIGFDISPKRFAETLETYGGLQGGCDEMEFKSKPKVTTDVQFATGTINPVAVADDAWKKCYTNIRRVNIFLEGIQYAPLQEGRKMTYIAEARFLRAWYYSILLKHYGGVPIINEDVYTVEDQINMKRNTYEECVNYIISECNKAIPALPNRPTGRDYGRAGAGACRGLIARVLLYGASPLYNGSSFGKDSSCPKELVGYPTEDHERWRLAAEAAAAVIASGNYKLYTTSKNEYFGDGAGFALLFLAEDTEQHSGHVLDWRRSEGRERENLFQPPSRGSNVDGGFPYQELVDAFLMKDGSRPILGYNADGSPIINPESGYDDSNPYENREKRFYHSIYYDQSIIMNKEIMEPINTYLNPDGTSSGQDAVHQGTPTGYYNGKMLDRQRAGNFIHTGQQSIPLIRYAEILLNYAEAQNEYAGPKSGIIGGQVFTPYDAIIAIRKRAAIEEGDGLYGLKDNMTQEEMREVIRHERRIELAVEGHRFWDVRRWMIADETENRMMTGMEVQLQADGTKTYKRFDVREHVFRADKSMYLWPIPYKEEVKSSDLIQNPYYN